MRREDVSHFHASRCTDAYAESEGHQGPDCASPPGNPT